MGEDFEKVEFSGLKFIAYMSQYASLVYRHDVDYYLTTEKYEELRRYSPDVFSRLPGRLEQLLTISWPHEIPEQLLKLFSKGRIAIVEGHGGRHSWETAWGISSEGGRSMPVQELIDTHLADYDTVMFAVCNEDRLSVQRNNGGLIYPNGMLGDWTSVWEMVVMENGIQLCVTPGLSKYNRFNWVDSSETL